MLETLLAVMIAAATTFAPALQTQSSDVDPVTGEPMRNASSAAAKKLAKLPRIDIAVGSEQLLIGQVVSPQGHPLAGVEVAVDAADGRFAVTKTNAQGAFAFRGVSGLAELYGPQCRQPVRAWAGEAAPPAAMPAVLLVEGTRFARGQHRPGPLLEGFVARSKKLMANPVFVAGVVGTAVAVPVALSNSDDDEASSP